MAHQKLLRNPWIRVTDEFEKAMPALENGKNNGTSKIIAQSMDKGD